MGYSKMDYNNYMDNIEYWLSLGVELPLWADEVNEHGGKPLCAIDFYDDIFGDELEEHRTKEDGYLDGEYGAIALELDFNDKGEKVRNGKRTTVTRGNLELYDLIDRSEKFCLMAPMSYAGKNRTNKNARFLYALCIEIDNIQGKSGINELFYSWQRDVARLPRPTYIVCSGSGIHLYFVFENAIPMYANVFEGMSECKKYLTPRFWNGYVTTMKSKREIQWESLNQAFRIVGTKTKKNAYTMAFKVGEKVTIEYLNKFLPDDKQMDSVYKSKYRLEKAKELYPEWYQKRIVEKQERGHWNRYKPIYYNWIDKIYSGAEVGHRYHCLENLCSLAVQCCIEPEQVEKDCREVAEYLEGLTTDDKNHFTEYDIISALRTYHEASEGAYRRKIEYISEKTGIELIPNKRRKKPLKRDDGTAFRAARAVQDIADPNGTWRNKDGRPKKSKIVEEWRKMHPDGKKADCIRETGLSKPTVYKWWNGEECEIKQSQMTQMTRLTAYSEALHEKVEEQGQTETKYLDDTNIDLTLQTEAAKREYMQILLKADEALSDETVNNLIAYVQKDDMAAVLMILTQYPDLGIKSVKILSEEEFQQMKESGAVCFEL